MSRTWILPAPGDIVWRTFPEVPNSEPGPKPRPAIVLSVEPIDSQRWMLWRYPNKQ